MRQIIDKSVYEKPARRERRCVGFFFSKEKGAVRLDMGYVSIFPVIAFRAAPSAANLREEDEPKNLLSWAEEGAAQNAVEPEIPGFSDFDLDQTFGSRNTSGSYVIPGLSAMVAL